MVFPIPPECEEFWVLKWVGSSEQTVKSPFRRVPWTLDAQSLWDTRPEPLRPPSRARLVVTLQSYHVWYERTSGGLGRKQVHKLKTNPFPFFSEWWSIIFIDFASYGMVVLGTASYLLLISAYIWQSFIVPLFSPISQGHLPLSFQSER